jgi:hypothetical protein
VKGPSFPYLNREALELRADPVSKKWQDRVRARWAAANSPNPTSYKMPSQTANKASWDDARVSGKTHIPRSARHPSKFFYVNRTNQDRHDALPCGQRQDDPSVKVSVETQKDYWAGRRNKGDYYLALAEKHAAALSDDPAHFIKQLLGCTTRSKKSHRVLPDAEHGGNLVMVVVGRKNGEAIGRG